MNDPIQVRELAASGRDLERFLKFSHSIYRHDPCWVAPLLMDLRSLFSPQNPFFQHAEMKPSWLGKTAGTWGESLPSRDQTTTASRR
jgi:hypothetical protein